MTRSEAAVKICSMLLEFVGTMLAIICWVAGVALSHGFWERVVAVAIFPYAWVVTAEAALKAIGWLA